MTYNVETMMPCVYGIGLKDEMAFSLSNVSGNLCVLLLHGFQELLLLVRKDSPFVEVLHLP